MEVFQSFYQNEKWTPSLSMCHQTQLVLAFGDRSLIENSLYLQDISTSFPKAEIIACSTSGEILGEQVYDGSVCLTAITFEQATIQVYSDNIEHYTSADQAGEALASQLDKTQLKHVLVFADGQNVNGSALVKGLKKVLPHSVTITGGLAADGDNFEKTWLCHNNKTESGMVIVCGLYGKSLRVGHGSYGGWDAFGPERLITKAKKNILYELDGESALLLYKRYLGEYSDQLPRSALKFPLQILQKNESRGVVRTILNVNEAENSMTFAGDIEEGSYAQLMHASFDRIVDGAETAAKSALAAADENKISFALLISCVGRRLLLGQRVEEELEVVCDILGSHVPTCGFYSYGEIAPMCSEISPMCSEISPICSQSDSVLHNQTMTITTFSEVCNA